MKDQHDRSDTPLSLDSQELQARISNALGVVLASMPENLVSSLEKVKSDNDILIITVANALLQLITTTDDGKSELRNARDKLRMANFLGGSVTADSLAEILMCKKQTVMDYRAGKKILGLPVGASRYLFPVWQVDNGVVIDGLKECLFRLVDRGFRDPWVQLRFFVTENKHVTRTTDALSRTPAHALLQGDTDLVLDAVDHFKLI